MTKMNPEVKAAWLTALRSGEYTQGRGKLNKGGEFCCLGVLCDIAVKQFDIQVDLEEVAGCGDEECCPPVMTYDGQESFPPAAVLDWSGLRNESGILAERVYVPEAGEYTWALYSANDLGLSFAEIANVIEEQF